MNPLPDRVVITVLAATVGMCFVLVFWFVRLQPSQEPPLQWREGPSATGRSATVPSATGPAVMGVLL